MEHHAGTTQVPCDALPGHVIQIANIEILEASGMWKSPGQDEGTCTACDEELCEASMHQ